MNNLDDAGPLSLSKRVASALERMVQMGELGQPTPPERQLAQLLQVSRVTLRRAMASLEAKGIFRREQGRGTYVDRQIKLHRVDQLASLTSPAVAVLVHQDSQWFNPQLTPWTWRICCQLMPALAQKNIPLYLVNDEQFLSAALRGRLTQKQIVGFVAPTHIWETDHYESAMQCQIPWVGLGRTARSMFWNIIDPDWTRALRQAIADIKPTADDQVFIPCKAHPKEVDQQCWLETAMTELDRHHVPQSQIIVNAQGPFEQQGYLAMRWYLQEYGLPTIVLGTFDLSMVGVYRALGGHDSKSLQSSRGGPGARELRGNRGSRGIRFLGIGDLEMGRCLSPSLSTLAHHYHQVANTILEMLEKQQQTGQRVPLHRATARYIRRASSQLGQTSGPLSKPIGREHILSNSL